MSIKDLFDKGHSLKFLKNNTKDTIRKDLESTRYIDSYSKKSNRFVPVVDFTTASNFARFGSAEEYYDTAIKRIYQTYPYDGSHSERIEWENNSNYLDLFIFENEYPRTNGYVVLNTTNTYTSTSASSVYSASAPQYILFKGGPHPDPLGDYKNEFAPGASTVGISKANIYHTASQRTSNLEFDPSKGATVEFWMKKDGWAHESTTKYEFPFHLIASGATGDNYGSFFLRLEGTNKDNIAFSVQSGSVIDSTNFDPGIDDLADGSWHHYAFTFKTYGTTNEIKFYFDGTHNSTVTKTSGIVTGAFGDPLVATIGSLAGPLGTSLGTGAEGWGSTVSCSFDEFRYWKTERTAEQIGRYFRDQVAGGTNTDNIKYDDVSNLVDLGVYYKFNEGITTISSTDSTILDYSGRISNGTYINYSSTSRSTGSAIVLSEAATKEFKDPIIYTSHPDVSNLINNKKASGSYHDHENVSSIYKSVPSWITEDDKKNSGHLKYLTQIIASFFDDIYLQIEALPRLKDINYPDDTAYEKPLPFAEKLLTSRGFEVPELFADASALSKYLQRGEKKLFEKKLYEIKNTIYQNIYNNLSYIQKSKGTYKSLRNFLRCFGVDEELVKINVYSNNDTYEFKNNIVNTSVKKRYVDFDDAETRDVESTSGAYTATVYQYKDPDNNNSISYIPAMDSVLASGSAATIEVEVHFPKRSIANDVNYDTFPSLTSSIFGMNTVLASDTNYAYASDNKANFRVVAVKPDDDLRNVKFSVINNDTNSIFTKIETDSSYRGVYDNERWNLAFRVKPTKYPLTTMVSSSLDPSTSAYQYELYGVNYTSNILQDEFTISGSLTIDQAVQFFANPKRLFVGSARTNYTGTIEQKSDVKITSVRYWHDYLDNETIRAHALDASNYGVAQPFQNANLALTQENFIPKIKTLALHWSMDNVTGSNASGQFLVKDFTSGSLEDRTLQRYSGSIASNLTEYSYTARGDFFASGSAQRDQAIDVEFVQTARQKLPEVLNSDDMVKILNKLDDVVFTRDTTYVQHLISIEKSMYQVISEEMLRMFAGVFAFNNLVGEPVNRYRPNYKQLQKLREIFFEHVEESPDIEKFIEFYKWIDDAVTMMIQQLLPASSNTTDLLRNMVESHILERNKYWTKFPTIELKTPEPVSSLKGIEELKYNWRIGHAPVSPNESTNQNKNCLWWKQRAERSTLLASGDSDLDSNKDTLLKMLITEVSSSEATLKTSGGAKYYKSYFHNRSLARPVDFVSHKMLSLKGGSNSEDNKIHDFYKNIIKWGSDDDFIYLDVDNKLKDKQCENKIVPDELNKRKFRMSALVMEAENSQDSNADGTGLNDLQYSDAKSSLITPFTMYTSSFGSAPSSSGGYRGIFPHNLEFANMHEDRYGHQAEIPMQGTFSEKHVGGMSHRHVKLNQGSDNRSTRPEGWHLETFVDKSSVVNIIAEFFSNATSAGSTDVRTLNLPTDSEAVEPSPYEYWKNGVGADNSWTFIDGATPSAGTGPSSGKYAYCEVLPSKVGQTFSLITPLIDLLDLNDSSTLQVNFTYHMHGWNIGNLRVQASTDSSFETGVQNLIVRWSTLGSVSSASSQAYILSGQQHASPSDSFSNARIGLGVYGDALAPFRGKRFYIRFLYTAGIGHLGDCAIDSIQIFKSTTGGAKQNSFKLMHPTYDDVGRPYATLTRNSLAKRPVNIENIHTTGSTSTTAGNYLDRYEYISTMSPESNDPWFVKNVDQIASLYPERATTLKIEDLLNEVPGVLRSTIQYSDFALPNRSYISGTTRNRTRMKTRFSSPGGFETTSRGFLDPAHETYSVYNAMTYRNFSSRQIFNTQLQAHSGQFGVSAHDTTTARVFGSEVVGAITADNYDIVGDAARHKYHRNNIERIELTGADSDISDMAAVTASSHDNAFVSHMIPRTDKQYAWITGSLI